MNQNRTVAWMTTLRGRLSQSLRLYLPVLRQQLRRHGLPLALILIAALYAQIVLLSSSYTIGFFEDSKEYLYTAQRMVHLGIFFDPNRPPMYPLFLATVAFFNGWNNYQAIVFAQAGLMVLTAFELYYLGYTLTQRRWIATVVSLVIALNLPLVNMERSVLSESVAFWAAVTTFLLFARFLQTQRRRYLFAFAAISVIAILERPAFLFLPLLLISLEFLRTLRIQHLRKRWRYLLFCFVTIYGCLFLYVLGNKVTNNYFGFTYVSDINLFGKIIEYRMWDQMDDPSLRGMKTNLDTYLRTSRPVEPWLFPGAFPLENYYSNNYAMMGAYSHNVIEHHPWEYLQSSQNDIKQTLMAPPDNLVPLPHLSAVWQQWWLKIENDMLRSYRLILPLTGLLFIIVIIKPKYLSAFMLLCIALYTYANVVLVAMTDYAAFYRLRSPMDWGAIFALLVALLFVGDVAVRRIWQQYRPLPIVPTADLIEAVDQRQPVLVPTREREDFMSNGFDEFTPTVPRLPVQRRSDLPPSPLKVKPLPPLGSITPHPQRGVVIMGAGPAGLTAAYELTRYSVPVTVLEADPTYVGGISRTAAYQGYRFDIGGHRFFSKSQEIEDFWTEIMGTDLLVRPRQSRILYRGKYFDYPLKASNALFNLGIFETMRCLASYGMARLHPVHNPRNFEEWVSNQFGHRLFSIFFKTYTEKVWGIDTKELSADWAGQRIKGLNMMEAIRSALFPKRKGKHGEIIKTLIDEFRYPRYGPGQMWEQTRDLIVSRGQRVLMGAEVVQVRHDGAQVTSLIIRDAQGNHYDMPGQSFISTLPIRTLVEYCNPPLPPEVRHAAASLKYRDYLTVAIILNKPNVFPDNWIYLHDPDMVAGRIQNYKNWSPDMVADPQKTCLGLEYFCFEGDGLWTSTDEALVQLGSQELVKLKMCRPEDVVGGAVVRQPKAYPVYDETYKQHLAVIRNYLEAHMPNLQLVGRNGMHHYNNQDHSMMTALLAARNIALGTHFDPWKVNTDAEYHEEAHRDEDDPSGRQVPLRIPASAEK